jgi:hypothetical protein
MMIETVEALTENKLPALCMFAVRSDGLVPLTQAELACIAGGGSGAGINPSLACYWIPRPEPAPSVPPGGYEP